MPTRDEVIAELAVLLDGYSRAVSVDPRNADVFAREYGARADALIEFFAAEPGVAVPEPDEQQEWHAFPARQLTGTPHIYHAYVGHERPEVQCCGRDHRRADIAEVCARMEAAGRNAGPAASPVAQEDQQAAHPIEWCGNTCGKTHDAPAQEGDQR